PEMALERAPVARAEVVVVADDLAPDLVPERRARVAPRHRAAARGARHFAGTGAARDDSPPEDRRERPPEHDGVPPSRSTARPPAGCRRRAALTNQHGRWHLFSRLARKVAPFSCSPRKGCQGPTHIFGHGWIVTVTTGEIRPE